MKIYEGEITTNTHFRARNSLFPRRRRAAVHVATRLKQCVTGNQSYVDIPLSEFSEI